MEIYISKIINYYIKITTAFLLVLTVDSLTLSQVCTLNSGVTKNANIIKCIANVCPITCSVIGGSTMVEVRVPDGTKVELGDDWDLRNYKVLLNLIGQTSQLSFPGSGRSARVLSMNNSSYIQVNPANNGDANDADGQLGLSAPNGGNVRINIGTTSYRGNQFASSIIDSGGINVGVAPLPIALLSFDAKKVNSNIIVSWKTAMELNNDYFEIERSENGIDFYSIGEVVGSKHSQQIKEYSFVDDYLPKITTLYYRLTQYDLDGNFESFDIVAIHNSSFEEVVTAYPNPVNNQTRVYSPNSETEIDFDYEITNSYGKVITSGKAFWANSLELKSLKSGVYRLTINHTDHIKIVKN